MHTAPTSPFEGDLGAQTLRLQILGPLRIWQHGSEVDVGPHQQALLLAVLLSRSGKVVTVAEMVDAVWGADPPASAVNTVQRYVGALRRMLEPGLAPREPGSLLIRRGNGYVCSAGTAILDLAEFREHILRAQTAMSHNELNGALDAYLSALGLWTGRSCAGLSEGTSAATAFAALDAEFFQAARSAADVAMTLGQDERTLPFVRMAIGMDPLHEPLHGSLMLALNATGRRAEALGVYDAVRRRLAEELGIDAGPALQSAHRAVLSPASPPNGENALDPTGERDRAITVAPYRVADFSGRRDELDAIRSFVGATDQSRRTESVLLITGPPGVGKTTTALEAVHGTSGRARRLFVNLHGFDPEPLSPLQVLRALLLQVNPDEEPPGSVDEASAAWRSAVLVSPLVVILDNASSEGQVRPVLALDSPIPVVVTSRRVLPGLEASWRIVLGSLPRADSTSFLIALVRHSRVSDEELVELAELCGDFPLALRIAGARIASRPQSSVGDFIARLRDERNRLSQLVAGDLDVRSAFSLSYDALQPPVRQLFRSLSTVHGSTFSPSMAASIDALNLQVCRAHLDVLADLGLVEVVRGDRYRLHDLLRLYAADRSMAETSEVELGRKQGRLDRWTLEAATTAATAFPDSWAPVPLTETASIEEMVAAKNWLITESNHWFASLKSAAERGEHRLVLDTAMALVRISGQWSRWSKWNEVHAIGADSAARLGDLEAQVIQSLAATSTMSGEESSADEFQRTAAQTQALALSLGIPRWITYSKYFLAEMHLAQGRTDLAVFEGRAVAREFVEQGELTGEIGALDFLVFCLSDEDPREAMTIAEAALAVLDELGPNPERTVQPITVANIFAGSCRLLIRAGRYEEALALSTRLMAVPELEFVVGMNSTRALRHRGLALLGLGRVEEARLALESALANAGHYMPDWWTSEVREALASIPGPNSVPRILHNGSTPAP